MRRPDRAAGSASPAALALGGLLLATLLVSGCNRLTFIKPDTRRGNSTEITAPVRLRPDKDAEKRRDQRNQVALASQRLAAGELDAAEAEAKAALKTQRDDPGALTILAVVADRRGQSAAAGDLYRRVVDIAPTQGAGLSNYGAWLCNNGHAAESLVMFDRALKDGAYATPAAALANAGGCALDSGQFERAGRDLRQALVLDPGNAYALESMARNEFREGNLMSARAFSERRLAAAGASPSVLQLAARIERGLGDTRAASRYEQRLQAEFPSAAAREVPAAATPATATPATATPATTGTRAP